MTTIKKTINSKDALISWMNELTDFWVDNKYIQVTANDKRSLSTNSLLHYWYKVISVSTGEDIESVTAFCKYEFGRGILLSKDLELNDVLRSISWSQRAINWSMSVDEAKRFFFNKMPVTSTFTAEELNQYLAAIKAHYEPLGVAFPS
jgi:hypothetical protein